MQTTCTRKHNEPSQDSYLAAMPASAFSFKQADKMKHASAITAATKASSLIRSIKNHSKILKLLQFEKF